MYREIYGIHRESKYKEIYRTLGACIEFQLKELPPPPQITLRRDLGAHLRRQARHNSVPYRSSSDEDSSDTPNTIPKPKGEAGRSNSGGYNLKNALGWEEEHYSEFTTFINDAVKKKLDSKRCYSKQKPADLEELVQLTVQKFNIRNVYSKDWPVRDALKLRLKCTSDAEKKKVTRKTEANFKKVLRTSKGAEDEDQRA
ncbi:hypothetical protein BYT27DRAFT_7311487 [Phlegmacium glaucopus]|nr:hypothetical protein BYT27DRAFT_7311487 [Phlegmacium glaucopus]